MNKALLCAGLIAVAMVSTSCEFNFSVGSSTDTAKLQDLMADMICTTSDSVNAMTNTDYSTMTPEELAGVSAALEKKSEETKKLIEDMPAKYGFASDAAVSDAMKNVSDKTAFTDAVTKKANAKCTPKAEILQGMLESIK